MKFTEQYYLDSYIDYLNNFLTVCGYADYYHIDYNDAEFIIKKGRKIYQDKQPYQIEKIKCGKKVMFAVFPSYKSKFTVKLNECKIYKNLNNLIRSYIKVIYNNEEYYLLDAKNENEFLIISIDSNIRKIINIKELKLI